MDNISCRYSNEDTTTSMYLSFDAESTISTACYKTLDAMSDLSFPSAAEVNSLNRSEAEEMNSTLELHDNGRKNTPFKTVKKVEITGLKSNTPLRPLPKNILCEYKDLCSTPSKEQLLKTVDVKRGSDGIGCIDLGLAFLGVDDEKPAFFPLPLLANEENKENALPDTEEISTLSTCSSVEITSSVIEKKMVSSLSTVGSLIEEESVVEINKNFENKAPIDTFDNLEVFSVADRDNNDFQIKNQISNLSKLKENTEPTCETKIKTPIIEDKVLLATHEFSTQKPHFDELYKVVDANNLLQINGKIMEINSEDKTQPNKYMGLENHTKKQDIKNPIINKCESEDAAKNEIYGKKHIGSEPNIPSYISEPNLNSNKPSRITSGNGKRRSFLPTCKKTTLASDAEIEIPLLMSKMLKITDIHMKTKEDNLFQKTQVNETLRNSAITDKRRSMASIKAQTSLIPFASGTKRSFGFTQRMSVLVKTTLNSPARKFARKSSINSVTPSLQRRSVIHEKVTETRDSKTKKTELFNRKSMLPKTVEGNITTESHTKTMATLHEISEQPKTAENKSGRGRLNMLNNPDISYTCSFCKEKFRIKSLLDAHKRSHETDDKQPTFVKKRLTITQPVNGSALRCPNQCKYCDKKFALTKALHIHLLQNCPKIPPTDKKKLQYTDLNHVEKAQLPDVFLRNNLQGSVSSICSSASDTPRYKAKQNLKAKSSTESLNENKNIKKIPSHLINGNNVISAQTTAQKGKKISAHAGVYKTPSKSVPCHLCKLTFKSILDYTNHNLRTHGSEKSRTENDTGESVAKMMTVNNA